MTSTILTTLVGGEWEEHCSDEGDIYYVHVTTRERTPYIPPGYEDRLADDWEEDDIGPQYMWINQRTGRISMSDPHPPPPETYLDLMTFRATLAQLRDAPIRDKYAYSQVLNTILNWWFFSREGFMVHQTSKVVDIVMPAVTMTKVMKVRGEPTFLRDYLLAETKGPKEHEYYTESRFLQTLKQFVDPGRSFYALIQYGMLIKFYKWENGEGIEMSGRLHLARNVHEIMGILEYVRDNPLPLGDVDPSVSDF